MAIRFFYSFGDFEHFDEDVVRKWIEKVVKSRNKVVGSINYQFASDEEVYEKNITFLDHDTYTDIITFDYVVGEVISGDIIISIERVGENARKIGVSFDEELRRVIIHGVLHLLGQGDKTPDEATEMRRQEEDALRMFLVEQ